MILVKNKDLQYEVIEGLKKGQDVKLPGLGFFRVKKMAARQGRNPKTGAPLTVPAHDKIVFKVSGILKKAVLGK